MLRKIEKKSSLLLIPILAMALGCPQTHERPSGTSTVPSEKPPAAKVFADWESPKAVLVFTGDRHGYLEPCGCSERQSGGMARLGDLFRQLKEEKNWPYVALDVGGTLNADRVSYRQTQFKFDAIRNGMNQLGFQGLGLGLEELLLGASNLYTNHVNSAAIDGFDLPFLGGNVTFFGSKEIGTPVNSRILEAGGLKIGVVAITGETTKSKLEQMGVTVNSAELSIAVPSEAITAELEKLAAETPDLLVLLSHAEIEESKALAAAFPQLDIVVTAHSVEDPKPDPEFVGETMFVRVGKKGKHAAAVGVFDQQQLKLEMVELDMDRFQNAPAMIELMADYQATLKEHWDELMAEEISDPGDTFVGVDQCKTCHSFAYNVWKQTKHAHAYESLEKGRPGQEANWVTRIYDPECLCCHAVGWNPQTAQRYTSGFQDMETTPHLAGQQCENCHGPGAQHVQSEKAVRGGGEISEDVLSLRKSMRVTLAEAKERLCNRCHDLDNSPKFDFDIYWPKVNHSGRKD